MEGISGTIDWIWSMKRVSWRLRSSSPRRLSPNICGTTSAICRGHAQSAAGMDVRHRRKVIRPVACAGHHELAKLWVVRPLRRWAVRAPNVVVRFPATVWRRAKAK